MLELRIGSTLLLAIITTTQAQERPTFAALRYDENWSALCATPAKDFWEPVKCVRMSDEVGHYASFGGELRERVEALDAIDFGRAAASTDAYALHRFLLHADFHFGDSLRIFAQLGSHFESGRNGGPSPTDKDEADLQQAFIDVSTALGDGRATLRVGRQELTLGSSRIVSVRESPNVRRAFDGLRGFWQLKSLRIDTFYLRPVQIEPGALDDGANSNERFWGAQASGRLPLAPGGQADLYYLGYERDQARFAAGTGHELRHSIGVRLYGKRAALDWNTEALWQFGRFSGERIRAWTIASDTGYTLGNSRLRPRLGLKADIASGDRNLVRGPLQTFNALYPNPTYFSEASLIAPANIMDVQPTVTLSFGGNVGLVIGWDFMWKERTADSVYTTPPPLTPVAGSAGGARMIGNQIRLEPSWKPTPRVEVRAAFVHFNVGGALAQAGAHDVNFGMLSGVFRF